MNLRDRILYLTSYRFGPAPVSLRLWIIKTCMHHYVLSFVISMQQTSKWFLSSWLAIWTDSLDIDSYYDSIETAFEGRFLIKQDKSMQCHQSGFNNIKELHLLIRWQALRNCNIRYFQRLKHFTNLSHVSYIC